MAIASPAMAQCGPGNGSCCVEGGNGTPGCDDVNCCETVCEIDPFCCDADGFWDFVCADEAQDLCSICQVCPNEGDCCFAHPTPGCSTPSCCLLVCAQDPICCDLSWEPFCVDIATLLCDVVEPDCPNPDGGDCFTVTPAAAGCADEACCELVCAIAPACCQTSWSLPCVALAQEHCVGVAPENDACTAARGLGRARRDADDEAQPHPRGPERGGRT